MESIKNLVLFWFCGPAEWCLVFSLSVTLDFMVLILTNLRSEVLVKMVGSDLSISQISSIHWVSDRLVGRVWKADSWVLLSKTLCLVLQIVMKVELGVLWFLQIMAASMKGIELASSKGWGWQQCDHTLNSPGWRRGRKEQTAYIVSVKCRGCRFHGRGWFWRLAESHKVIEIRYGEWLKGNRRRKWTPVYFEALSTVNKTTMNILMHSYLGIYQSIQTDFLTKWPSVA